MIGLLFPIFVRWGLSQRFAKAAAWVALVIAAIALCAGLRLFFDSREKADDTANQEIGRTEAEATAMAKAIDAIEQGNQAREEIHAPGPAGDRARYDQCLRSARNPANCAGYLLPQFASDHPLDSPVARKP